jgi:hypothetical protein
MINSPWFLCWIPQDQGLGSLSFIILHEFKFCLSCSADLSTASCSYSDNTAAIMQSDLDFLIASEGLPADSMAKLLATGYYTLRRFTIMGDERPIVRTVLKDEVLIISNLEQTFTIACWEVARCVSSSRPKPWRRRSRRSSQAALKVAISTAC